MYTNAVGAVRTDVFRHQARMPRLPVGKLFVINTGITSRFIPTRSTRVNFEKSPKIPSFVPVVRTFVVLIAEHS
jgi:hypothetical protein